MKYRVLYEHSPKAFHPPKRFLVGTYRSELLAVIMGNCFYFFTRRHDENPYYDGAFTYRSVWGEVVS